MPLLGDFPSPPVERESFAGGFSSKGTALLTLDELEMYSSGKGARTERLYKCPFCGASERAFHVNTKTGAFNCKRSSCGVKGRLREFWPAPDQRRGAAFQGRQIARKPLSTAFTLSPDQAPKASVGGNWRAQWENALALDATGAHLGAAYVSQRGITVEVAQRAGVRFCRNWAPSVEGKSYFGGAAVLFPLLNRAGEVVAVGGRYLEPKPDGPKARTGGDAAQGVFRVPVESLDPLESEQPVLVEGPFDALALATCGAPAIALNGISLPLWLAHALAFKAPFLAPDGDEGGVKALPFWRREVAPFAPRVRVLEFAEELRAKDFGEAIVQSGEGELRAWLLRASVLKWAPTHISSCEGIESARTRFDALEALLGVERACIALARVHRRIERDKWKHELWCRLDAAGRHDLAVSMALLDCDVDPLWLEGATATL